MADVAAPIPDDMLVDDYQPPFTDDDLDDYFDRADMLAAEGVTDVDPVLAPTFDPNDPDTPRYGLPARWRIETLDDAEWAMARLAEAQRQVDELTAQREDWMRRASDKITRWFTRASRRPARTVMVMSAKLERYALEQRAADPKCKSVPLPSGTIKTTEVQPKAAVVDDAVLADYLEAAVRGVGNRPEAWRKAFTEHVGAWMPGAMAELVKRHPKVYVGPLRKLVTVAQVPTGVVTVTYDLSCGHDVTEHITLPEDEPVALGAQVGCPTCEPDPIDGAPQVFVTARQDEPLTEWRVLGPDGEPVPGATVELGETTAKAVPGA